MIKYFCDRCEAEIKDTMYHVNISSESLDPFNDARISSYDTVLIAADYININANIPACRAYCEKCKREIADFCGIT